MESLSVYSVNYSRFIRWYSSVQSSVHQRGNMMNACRPQHPGNFHIITSLIPTKLPSPRFFVLSQLDQREVFEYAVLETFLSAALDNFRRVIHERVL